jgi:hypothetical protein
VGTVEVKIIDGYEEQLEMCSKCDSAKIFLTSQFELFTFFQPQL